MCAVNLLQRKHLFEKNLFTLAPLLPQNSPFLTELHKIFPQQLLTEYIIKLNHMYSLKLSIFQELMGMVLS